MSREHLTVKEKFIKAIEKHSMLSSVSSVLVAFSGGADSALLLSLLSELPDIKVYAAHLNHMLRGEEAERDERFCRDFCRKLGITLFVKSLDVKKIAKERKKGVEETARDLRYELFSELSAEKGIDRVATAHNASDNAETVLFNLIRGCGSGGLSGIPPTRDNIIRPLILCSKEDILAECKARGIEFVYDSTNSDTDYTRNYIRHEIIPMAKRINPSFEASVSETSSLLRAENRYFEELSSEYSFDSGRSVLSSLDDVILGKILLRELRKNGISPDALHIKEAERLLRLRSVHASLSLSGGTLVCDRDKVFVAEGTEKKGYEKELSLGINEISEDIAVILCEDPDFFSKDINKLKNIYKLSIHTSLDSAKIDGAVFVRTRREGDKYFFGSMTRSVKKLFQAKKWPLGKRNAYPIFVLNDEIIWIPEFPVSDNYRPLAEEKKLFIYCFMNYFE